MMSLSRNSSGFAERYALGRPRHGLVRRALGPIAQRVEVLCSELRAGALREAFHSWLTVSLADEQTPVGRKPGRRGSGPKAEESEWPPSRVFALETALAEWGLGRAARRLALGPEQVLRLSGDLPLPVSDLSWGISVLAAEAEYEFSSGDPGGLATALYHKLLPRPVRHDLGLYHTPAALAGLVVELVWALDGADATDWSWMDPSCGFGVFLSLVAGRLGKTWPGKVFGGDISPLAVLLSRIGLLDLSLTRLGMAPEAAMEAACRAVRVEDVLLVGSELDLDRRVDVLLGNPPWVTWDRLVPTYRERIKRLVRQRPHLYDRSGFSTLLGRSSDDISALFTALASEHFLRPGGLVAMLLKKSLLTNDTGSWFRALSHAEPSVRMGMVQVEDLSACQGLFGQGGQETMVFVARKGSPGPEQVPVGLWRRDGRQVVLTRRVSAHRQDPSRPGSPWRLDGSPENRQGAAASSRGNRAGSWAYARSIHHGLKHDAEAVFVFTRIEPLAPGLVRAWPKQGTDSVVLETARLFRYVKPRHIQAYRIRGWEYVLVPQDRAGVHDQDAFARDCPQSFSYLRSQALRLERRKSRVFASGPFYGMFGLGVYTWAPHRILWSGLSFRPLFAPSLADPDPLLGDAALLPDSGCYSLSAGSEAEMWYLLGLLNSRPGRQALESVALGSKRPLSKTAMGRLSLPAFDPERPEMLELARLAERIAWALRKGEQSEGLAAWEVLLEDQVEALLAE